MGYHVTILRTAGGRQLPIGLDELRRALVPMAGRLALFPRDGELWLVRPELGEESDILIVEDEEIWAKGPGEEMLALMIELAGHLGARVRGDELETYRSVDDPMCIRTMRPPTPRRIRRRPGT